MEDQTLIQWAKNVIEDSLHASQREQLSGKWTVEFPQHEGRGDLSCNVALIAAKTLKLAPFPFAEELAKKIAQHPWVQEAWSAKAGFLNINLHSQAWQVYLQKAIREGVNYGTLNVGKGERVHLEFVSANPTGPLHVGHLRGAVLGDVMARLLKKIGYNPWREYYVNDAGAQVDALARSVYARYVEALGETPADSSALEYPGDYLKPLGERLAQQYGPDLKAQEWLPIIRPFAVEAMLQLIQADLKLLGITFDEYFHEKDLIATNMVQAACEDLTGKNLVYEGVLDIPKGKKIDDWEPRSQTLFRASLFGDDVDRPLKKSDGSWTYFASDIAYHFNKFKRGFTHMINVFGADHAGYIKRLEAACAAISDRAIQLDVRVCQLVRLSDNGVSVRMSKRAGHFITLREVVEEVGADAVRFLMLSKKNDAPLDFDFAKAKEQSKENWVFYVQYAHARICSVFRWAAQEGFSTSAAELAAARFDLLNDEKEQSIIKKVSFYSTQVQLAAQAHEPHRIVFYLHDLASAFHELWNKGKEDRQLRFIHKEDATLTHSRLSLLKAVQATLHSGLDILGIQPLEEMN